MFARVKAFLGSGSAVLEAPTPTTPPEASLRKNTAAIFTAEFSRIEGDSRLLGDMAEIFAGITPRQRTYRRYAPPAPDWRAILTRESVQPFRVEQERVYMPLIRQALVRLPRREEFDQPEKVVVHHHGPPLVAAVDTSRCPFTAGLYAIVPAKGLACGYITGILNSRLIDYFFQLKGSGASGKAGAYVQREQLARIPIPLSQPHAQKKLIDLQRALRKVKPPRPGRPISRDYTAHMALLNAEVYRLYGLSREAIRHLQALYV